MENEFTLLEKTIAKCLYPKYKYIARNQTGRLFVFPRKPEKDDEYHCWCAYGEERLPFDDMFQAAQWDTDPVRIRDVFDPLGAEMEDFFKAVHKIYPYNTVVFQDEHTANFCRNGEAESMSIYCSWATFADMDPGKRYTYAELIGEGE